MWSQSLIGPQLGHRYFFKKNGVVPIHKDYHWSLAVVTNAGIVDCCNEDDEPSEIPCILHLDGLSLHDRKVIAANIRIWLNAEWNKKILM